MKQSYNSIDLYDKCQFSYKLKYKMYQKLPIYEYKTIIGMILHKFLDQYFTPLNKIKNINYFEFENNNKKYYIEENFFGLEKEDIEEIFNEFLLLIQKDFFKKIENLENNELISELNLQNDNLIGNLDLLIRLNKNKALIIDYKSGSSFFNNFEQLYIYAILVFENYSDINELMLIIYYFNENKTLKHLFYRNEYKFYKSKIENKIKKIENTTYFEKNLDNCKNCFYKKICDNYTFISNLKKEILYTKKYDEYGKCIISEGNYISKKIILFEKPNLKTIEKNYNQSFIFDKVNKNDFLILYTNFFLDKENILKNEFREYIIKIINELDIEKIYCIGEKPYQFLTKSNTKINYLENKTFDISFKENKNIELKVLQEEKFFLFKKDINTDYYKNNLI